MPGRGIFAFPEHLPTSAAGTKQEFKPRRPGWEPGQITAPPQAMGKLRHGGTETVSTKGQPPEEPVLAHSRSAIGHCPCRQLGPPACCFLAGTSLSQAHPYPSRSLCETGSCTSTGHPPASSPALLSPGYRQKTASRQPGKAEMLKYSVQGGGMIPLPNSPSVSSVHPSAVQGTSRPEAAPVSATTSPGIRGQFTCPALGIGVQAPSPLPAPCRAMLRHSME